MDVSEANTAPLPPYKGDLFRAVRALYVCLEVLLPQLIAEVHDPVMREVIWKAWSDWRDDYKPVVDSMMRAQR